MSEDPARITGHVEADLDAEAIAIAALENRV
jgi:hypothetical protein